MEIALQVSPYCKRPKDSPSASRGNDAMDEVNMQKPQCQPVVTIVAGKLHTTWEHCLAEELFGKPCKSKLGCCEAMNERVKDINHGH